MVTVLESTQRLKAAGQKGRLFVEIIGTAGAGKSTLFRALENSDLKIQSEGLPPVWHFSYIPFFVKNILALVPMLVRLIGKGDRAISRRELAWMAMLNGWPEILEKESNKDGEVSLFDQGPIFLIAILTGFGPTSLRCPYTQSWWEKIYRQWNEVFDIVIWLDASDEVLIKRINKREEDHLMKGKSIQETVDFLATYRNTYEGVIKKMTANNPKIRFLRVDTAINSVDEIVFRVTSELDAWSSEISG